jgi:hypothetical protein
LFDAARGKFTTVSLRNYQECYRQAQLIRDLGFEPEDFADHSRYDRAKVCAISAISYLHAEAWLRQRHGQIRIPVRDNQPLGIRLHLADANPQRLIQAGSHINPQGCRLYLADTGGLRENYARADAGIKCYLGDAMPAAHDTGAASRALGPKLILVEHPYKGGGVM